MKKGVAFFAFFFLCAVSSISAVDMVEQYLDYSDHLVNLNNNPARGVTSHRGIYLKPGKTQELTGNLIYADFMRLLIDLGGFSSNAWTYDEQKNRVPRGVSQPLDEVSLNNVRAVLDSIRRRGGTCTIRTSYDIDCRGDQDPGLTTTLTHAKQLAEIYSDYEDVIHYVEVGMFGTCGEQTSGSGEHMVKTLQVFLDNSSSGIKYGMRSPQTVGLWLGLKDYYEKGGWYIYPDWRIDSKRFQDSAQARGELMTRVGLYNDGYLGSDDDLGTYLETGGAQGPITREHIIEWMEEYGKVVPYGGDFVCNYNGDKRPPLNTGKYLAYEGFRTHTSYIGGSMSDKCYNFMDTVTFVGPDPEYSGKTKEKEYARDHFGYRFVLRDSKIIESVGIGGLLKMNLKIQNVGFANNLVSKKATVILKNGSTTLELPMNVDPTKIYSKKLKMKTGVDDNPTKMWTGSNYSDIIEDTPEFDGVNELNPVIKLPEDMQEGEWEVYMRISHYGDYKTDNNYHVIQFANDTNYFDKVTGSNYLGKFILSNSTYVDPGEFPPSSSSEIQWSSSSSSKISDEWFSSSSLALDLLDTCVTFVKGAGGYGENCYNDGLDSMTIGKCYTLNPGRDLETVAIPKKANNSFYWREFDCGSWKGIRDSIVIARGGYVESSSSAEESSSSEEFESSSSENGESSSSAEESSSSTGEEGLRDGFNFNNNIHLTISHRSIQITGMAPNTSVTLMDLQGRTLLRKQSTKSSCELIVSQPGKYLVRLGNSIELVTVK